MKRELINIIDFYREYRYKLFNFLLLVFKVKEGQKLPWFAIIVRFFIFPINTLWWWLLAPKNQIYDILTNTYLIHGIKYSDALFHAWSRHGLPVGSIYRVVKRDNNGVLTIEDLTFDKLKKLIENQHELTAELTDFNKLQLDYLRSNCNIEVDELKIDIENLQELLSKKNSLTAKDINLFLDKLWDKYITIANRVDKIVTEIIGMDWND